jgi:hypothetical protein
VTPRAEAAQRALSLAKLERRPYVVWLANPERYVVTSARDGDDELPGFYARVTPDGAWRGPGADLCVGALTALPDKDAP